MNLPFCAVAALMLLHLSVPAAGDPNPRSSENWKTDFSRHSVPMEEIISGGPPKDGIPPLDDPVFVTVAEADMYSDNEPVIALQIEGDARAYPLSVLTWHEIANDSVGGQPVTVTYCPLCNAAIAFSRSLDGRVLDFGTTGRLRKSDLVMYDRQTESWWQQFTGEAIIGELTGKELSMVPSTTIPFGEFAKRHPDGRVLIPNDGSLRRYGQNPYAYYDTADTPFLYRGDLPEGIFAMERVVIAGSGETPAIVTLKSLREAGTLTKDGYEFSWRAGMASALDAPEIAKGRDVGHVEVTRQGELAIHHVTFAFVAHAFHPEAEIFGK